MGDSQYVPGTVHLVDLEGVLRAKHAEGGQKDIVLIPAPSDDPDDPLNWSASRKLLSITSISVSVDHLLGDRFIAILITLLVILSLSASPPLQYIPF